MSDTVFPLTRERHGNKFWLRVRDFGFSREVTAVPLAAAELSRAAVALPMGFATIGEETTLVAIVGLERGKNLFVAPDGRWIAPYVPAMLRGHPFRLGHGPDGEAVLCVDESSDCFVGPTSGGIPFYAEDGGAHEETRKVLDFLVATQKSVGQLKRAVAALEAKNVLAPWNASLDNGAGKLAFSGYSRVSEEALAKLSDADYLYLRKEGAIPVAYSQLLSSAHIGALGKLTELHAKHQGQGKGLFDLTDSDTIRFN